MSGLSKVIVLDPDVRAGRQIQFGFHREGVPTWIAPIPVDAGKLDLFPGGEEADTSLVVVGGAAERALDLIRRARDLLETAHIDAPIVFAGNGVHRGDAEAAGADEVVLQPVHLRDVVTIGRMLRGQPQHQRTHLIGNLSEMTGVFTLVRALSALGRSATLTLIRGLRRGEVRFFHGEVTSAQVGLIHGQAALHQLLLWTDARFDFHHEDIVRRHQIPLAHDELFADAERFLATVRDESGPLSPSMVLEQDVARIHSLGRQIPTEVHGVLRMFDGHRVLADVLEDSPYRVFETLRVTQRALDAGLLRQASTPRPKATWRAVLAIEEWLVGSSRASTSNPTDSGPMKALDNTGPMPKRRKRKKREASIPVVVPAIQTKPEIDWGALVPRVLGAEVGPLSGVVPAAHTSGEIVMPTRGEPREKLEALMDTDKRERIFPRDIGLEPTIVVFDEHAEPDAERAARAEAEAKAAAERAARAEAEAEAAERAARAEAEAKAAAERAAEVKARDATPAAETVRKVRAGTEGKTLAEPEVASEPADPATTRQEDQARARADAEAKVRADAEHRARAAAEAKAQAEANARDAAEAKARGDAEAKARADAVAKVRDDAEAKARDEAEAKARADAEAKARDQAEAKARDDAEAKTREDADAKAAAAVEAKFRAEAEARARVDAEAEAARVADEQARVALETEARLAAETKAREEAAAGEARARAEAERRAQVAAEAKAAADRAEAEVRAAQAKAREDSRPIGKPDKRARAARREAKRRDALEAKAIQEARARAEAAAYAAAGVEEISDTERTQPRERIAVAVTATDLVKQLVAADRDGVELASEPPPVVVDEHAITSVSLRDRLPVATPERTATASEAPRAPQYLNVDTSAGPQLIEISDGVVRKKHDTIESGPAPARYSKPVHIVDDRPEDKTGEITTPMARERLDVPAEPSIVVPAADHDGLVSDLAAAHTAISAIAAAQAAAPHTQNAATVSKEHAVIEVRDDAQTAFSDIEEDFFRAGTEDRAAPTPRTESFEDLDEGYERVGFWDRLLGRKPQGPTPKKR